MATRAGDHQDTQAADDTLVLEDVAWRTDEDGTAWFVHDGWRYELDDDGYAYAVTEVGGSSEIDPASELEAGSEVDAPTQEGGDHSGGPAADRGTDVSAETTASIAVVPGTAVPQQQRAGDLGRASGRDATAVLDPTEPGAQGTPLLRLTGVRSGYGPLPVLHGVDLEIAEGRTAVLFGLNGAGKTTTAMNICGALPTWAGTIEFDGQDVTRWSTKRCVDAGIVMVPEGRRVFPELSVERNLQVGSWSQRRDGDWVASQREVVLDYFPRLRERLDQLAGTLSGGEQQMLAIARGLMARPKLLIVDEASMGLAPVIVKDVFDIVRAINEDGVTVLLIEQNVGALDVADLGVVMAQGAIVRTLTGAELTDRSVVSRLLMG